MKRPQDFEFVFGITATFVVGICIVQSFCGRASAQVSGFGSLGPPVCAYSDQVKAFICGPYYLPIPIQPPGTSGGGGSFTGVPCPDSTTISGPTLFTKLPDGTCLPITIIGSTFTNTGVLIGKNATTGKGIFYFDDATKMIVYYRPSAK